MAAAENTQHGAPAYYEELAGDWDPVLVAANGFPVFEPVGNQSVDKRGNTVLRGVAEEDDDSD